MANIRMYEQNEGAVEGRTIVRLSMVSEMAGQYPDIPLPDDIDREAIKARGFKYVTLPVAQIDSRSRNNRTYKREAVQRLAEQINARRPEGGWGHLRPEEHGTRYDNPPIRWLAATMDDSGVVWAKGLPLTQEAQEYYALARDTNARVGTSLYAAVAMEGEDVTDMDLLRLDLADPARVGIPMTAAKPHISLEMDDAADADKAQPDAAQPQQDQPDQVAQENNDMGDNTTVIADVLAQRSQYETRISELEDQVNRLKVTEQDVQTLRELLGIGEADNLVRSVRTLREQAQTLQTENAALVELAMASELEEKVKVPSMRAIVADMVLAQKPATREQLTNAIDGVLARDSIKRALQAEMETQSGPPQRTSTHPQQDTDDWKQFLTLPGGN